MLTKDTFQKLNEADLRKKVLIPLLQAMKYRDVYEYHGGAGEQGKDIVCWKPDDLSSRKNLALVVKATKMSGQAQVGKGTAGEVQTQISQCFGASYIDPSSGEDQEVHHVWVVSNKKITKEAVNAIRSALASTNLVRNVSFIGGNQLWELVEKYLALSMWPFVEEVQKHIQEVDSHYEPQVTISGKETSIAIVEKFPGAAEEKPIIINQELLFPTAEDSETFKTSFQQRKRSVRVKEKGSIHQKEDRQTDKKAA